MPYSDIKRNRIPHARERLRQLSAEMRDASHEDWAQQLTDIVDGLMTRRPPTKPIARARSRGVTSDTVRRVLADHAAEPTLHNRVLGQRYGIDGGRVSEIISGLRTVDNPSIGGS